MLNRIREVLLNKQKLAVNTGKTVEQDLLCYIKSQRHELCALESKLLYKSLEDIESEYALGLEILDYDLNEFFDKKTPLVIIPPKYEFWVYFMLALKFVLIGYPVRFLYFGWSEKIVKKIENKKTHIQYKNLEFFDVEKYELDLNAQTIIFNFSESFSGIKTNVPSFSTAIVTQDSDIDFSLAYILNHAFSFAGLKKSNLKRIIIDKEIEKVFLEKLLKRIELGNGLNNSFVKSGKTVAEIQELMSEAISDGAEVIWGDGLITPDELPKNIVISGVTPSMRIFQKKIYGPILTITSTDFHNDKLDKVLSMQPSRGVVVLGEIAESSLPEDYYYAFRNSAELSTKDMLLHNHPSLEYLFKKLEL